MFEENNNPQPQKGGDENTEEEHSQEELQDQIAQLKQERDNVVGELKEDRQKRQELQQKVDELSQELEKAKNPPSKEEPPADGTLTPDTVKTYVTQALEEREASLAEQNKNSAFERFVTEHQEFSEDNDPAGLKRKALEEKLARFNTTGLKTENDFRSVIEDAHKLLRDTDTSRQSAGQNPYSSEPGTKSSPKATVKSEFSDDERKLMERNGMSEERFKKLKERDPDYVEKLLQWIR